MIRRLLLWSEPKLMPSLLYRNSPMRLLCCVSRSRSRDEGCSALRNRLIGSRLQTA
ncbi:hypothetical protein [Pasteuria penetrans]|uniref:hypothetical protein n=1 Tax=Pasteuria penetrans TaxID=86005 RepID=UPI00165B11FA|nr:hypothetical protein [Pasteuria penetrans]